MVSPGNIPCPVEKCHISAVSDKSVSFFQQSQLPVDFVWPRP